MPLMCGCILAYQFLICIEYILENTFTVMVQGRRLKIMMAKDILLNAIGQNNVFWKLQ